MNYADAAAFRQALEQRLRTRTAGDGARLTRDRKRVAIDRLLARLVEAAPDGWLLKGGFALDLRLSERARSTRDVDIEWKAAEAELFDTLIHASELETDDFFTFEVELTGAPPERLGGSHRFRATAHLAGRQFETFLLDVGVPTDPIGEHDTLTTPDLLAFAGIDPVDVPAVPLERQIAEKLHAYTSRYAGDRPSSRVKDLIDIVLMSELASFAFERLREVIVATFEARATQPLPDAFPAPPSEWAQPYRVLAEEVGLDPDSSVGHRLAAEFLDPILVAEPELVRWDETTRRWRTGVVE